MSFAEFAFVFTLFVVGDIRFNAEAIKFIQVLLRDHEAHEIQPTSPLPPLSCFFGILFVSASLLIWDVSRAEKSVTQNNQKVRL